MDEALTVGTDRSAAPKAFEELPLPFGWFAIALSPEIVSGEIKILRYFGTEFVVWRGEDGKLHATDPYCRHLGAHLGHGGKVVGNNVECPFHHWRYDGTGAVVEIPYAKIIPPKVRRPCIKSWPIQEADGVVFAWYHPKGEPPLWELARFPVLENDEWKHYQSYQTIIGIHVQEITENGVDYPHFLYVHGTKSLPKPKFTIDGYRRTGLAEAKMETPRGMVDGQIRTEAIGPGQSFVRFSGIAEVLNLVMATPIDNKTTHLRFELYYPKSLTGSGERAAQAVAREVVGQLEQDRPIWEHKRYEPSPVLCDGDGPIIQYRRQYAQYYVK